MIVFINSCVCNLCSIWTPTDPDFVLINVGFEPHNFRLAPATPELQLLLPVYVTWVGLYHTTNNRKAVSPSSLRWVDYWPLTELHAFTNWTNYICVSDMIKMGLTIVSCDLWGQ